MYSGLKRFASPEAGLSSDSWGWSEDWSQALDVGTELLEDIDLSRTWVPYICTVL
jgi:hypothetical protein